MTPERLAHVAEVTWPPATATRLGPWRLRFGAGGGKRVSAATAEAAAGPGDIPLAEEAMRGLGQDPLFMLRPGEETLDAALADRGYRVVDPVVAYAVPVAGLAAERGPDLSSFHIWPPLAVQRDLWAAGGIGPARLAVMDRVRVPKTAVFGRVSDRPAGSAFVAVDKKVAMVHAIEVAPELRRKAVGRNMLLRAARWAQDQGGETLSLLVTQANAPARSLYSSLGMDVVGEYHYRVV